MNKCKCGYVWDNESEYKSYNKEVCSYCDMPFMFMLWNFYKDYGLKALLKRLYALFNSR